MRRKLESSTGLTVGPDGNIDYRSKIKLFIRMQELQLIQEAVMAGIREELVETILKEESLIDFSLAQIRLAIAEREKRESLDQEVEAEAAPAE